MAHLRPVCVHWLHPLTAPGAAQACPACLPVGANQRTLEGDPRQNRRIEKAVRFAPEPSQIGGCIPPRPAFPGKTTMLASVFLRTCAGASPICRYAHGVSGCPAHAFRSGQIGAPVGAMCAHAAHFRESIAVLQASLQIGGRTFERPALSLALWQNFAPDALICGFHSGRRGLRPLVPPAFAKTANQRSFTDLSGFARRFVASSPSPKPRLRAQRNGEVISALPAISPWHDRSCREPFPPGRNHRHSIPEPEHTPPTPGRRIHTASISRHHLPTGRTDESPTGLPFLAPSFEFHASKPPRQRPLSTSRNAHRPGRHLGRILLPLAGSKILAYQAQTGVGGEMFNRPGTFCHPASPCLADQARCSEVMQESDFRRKITLRKKAAFSSCPPRVRRGSGILQNAIRLSFREHAEFKLFNLR